MTPSHPSLGPMRTTGANDRSLGELFSELAGETGTLVRNEVKLATAEVTEKAKHAGKDAALVGVGAALGYAGLLALTFALIFALATAMALWVAALIVGAALCIAAAILAQTGRSKMKQIDPVPRAAVETVKEDARWAARKAKEVRS